MTRQQLEKVYILKLELKMWEVRLDELYSDMSTDSVNYDGMPHSVTNSTSSPTERKAIQIAEHVENIKQKAKEIRQAVMEVERFISGVDDSLMRQILEQRCVYCNTWEQIGETLGYDRTSVAKKYNAFINKTFPQFPLQV